MIPVISVLFVATLSVVVIRVATVALVHTGMGREAARFQARSAFTGVGFTTSEAESVVTHPVRRRIAGWLMIAGNLGIVTAMSSLLLSFVDMRTDASRWIPLGVLAGGLIAVLALSSSAWVDRHVCRAISWALNRFTQLDARDYARLLHLHEDYGVSNLRVQAGEWSAGRTLEEAGLTQEGILVLGIECPGGTFIGAPAQDTEIRELDSLILYGRTARIAEIDRRRSDGNGERSHIEAVEEQKLIASAERAAAGRT
jgi:hypothetical protein